MANGNSGVEVACGVIGRANPDLIITASTT
jgi:hypothetical protein